LHASTAKNRKQTPFWHFAATNIHEPAFLDLLAKSPLWASAIRISTERSEQFSTSHDAIRLAFQAKNLHFLELALKEIDFLLHLKSFALAFEVKKPTQVAATNH